MARRLRRGRASKHAASQPSRPANLLANSEAAQNERTTRDLPVGRAATRSSFHQVSQAGADHPTRRPSRQLACLPANQPASHPPRIHAGKSCLLPSAPLCLTHIRRFPCRKPSEEYWAADTPVGNGVERMGGQAGAQPTKQASTQAAAGRRQDTTSKHVAMS